MPLVANIIEPSNRGIGKFLYKVIAPLAHAIRLCFRGNTA